MYAINYKTLAYKGQLTGRLKVSVVSTGKYVMPFFLSNFMQQHPGVELMMDVTNKDRVFESLEKNEIDFALVSILPNLKKFEKLDLLQNKLYLVGSAEATINKASGKKEILKDLPFIFRESGSGTRELMESFFERNNISVLKKMELTSNEAVKQSLLAGLGYSIMPLIGIIYELQNKKLQIIPVKGLPIKTTWSLIWLKEKKHSPAAIAFLEELKNEKSTIVDKNFKWNEEY
jgi:DNA-binding transcriptional LysR family regulator